MVMLVKDLLCSRKLLLAREKVKGKEMQKYKNLFLLKRMSLLNIFKTITSKALKRRTQMHRDCVSGT